MITDKNDPSMVKNTVTNIADNVLIMRVWQNPWDISLVTYDRLNNNKPMPLTNLIRCRDFLNAYIQDAQEREKTDDL